MLPELNSEHGATAKKGLAKVQVLPPTRASRLAHASASSSSSSSGGHWAGEEAKPTRKAKRRPKVARGRMAKALVFKGAREKTSGGLTSEQLMQNRRGKIVSKRASAHGTRAFANIESWLDCVMEARRALHIRGFVAINGKSLLGKALYAKSKALQKAEFWGPPATFQPAPGTPLPAPAEVGAQDIVVTHRVSSKRPSSTASLEPWNAVVGGA